MCTNVNYDRHKPGLSPTVIKLWNTGRRGLGTKSAGIWGKPFRGEPLPQLQEAPSKELTTSWGLACTSQQEKLLLRPPCEFPCIHIHHKEIPRSPAEFSAIILEGPSQSACFQVQIHLRQPWVHITQGKLDMQKTSSQNGAQSIGGDAGGGGGTGDGSQMSELHLREFLGRATTVGCGLRHIPLWVEWVYNGMTWMGSYNQKNTLTFTLHRCSSIMTHHVYAHQFLGKSPTRLTQRVSQAKTTSATLPERRTLCPHPHRATWLGRFTHKRKNHTRIRIIFMKWTKCSKQHYFRAWGIWFRFLNLMLSQNRGTRKKIFFFFFSFQETRIWCAVCREGMGKLPNSILRHAPLVSLPQPQRNRIYS